MGRNGDPIKKRGIAIDEQNSWPWRAKSDHTLMENNSRNL